MSDIISDIVTRIKIWSGACAAAAGNKDLTAAVNRTKFLLGAAAQGTELSKNLPNATNVFRDSQEALGKVGESLEKMHGVCLDAMALTEIYEGIRVLNEDGIIQRDGDKAAEAFGKVLGGFGRLANHLPPPGNAYAAILEGCGGDFFRSMRAKLDPEVRWKKQFQEIEGF
jgi:hypothetical protein